MPAGYVGLQICYPALGQSVRSFERDTELDFQVRPAPRLPRVVPESDETSDQSAHLEDTDRARLRP